jgi:hypothetical protein
MTDHKRITGQKAIDILQCIPRDLINYMREGLTAFHDDGSEVYNLDNPDTGPGWVDHLQANRRHTVNEMRMARGGASATVREFPDGWYGLSFSADETLEKVKGLYFQLKDIEALLGNKKAAPEQQPEGYTPQAGSVADFVKGAQWHEIEVSVPLDDRESVRIEIINTGAQRFFSWEQLGMKNKNRSKKFTKAQTLMRDFARYTGRFSQEDLRDMETTTKPENLSKDISDLRKALKGCFGIEDGAQGGPIRHGNTNTGYVTAFQVKELGGDKDVGASVTLTEPQQQWLREQTEATRKTSTGSKKREGSE